MSSGQRETWGNTCQFFLSSLGLAVGLGNVWRFPYICYNNGGGSFLIPYLLMLFLIGIPGLFLEQSIGQYARVGANKLFGRMVPLFKGLGYGMVTVRFVSNISYVIVCAWSFFYMFAGFSKDIPWATCTEYWNTYDCYTTTYAEECESEYNSTGVTFYAFNCTSKNEYCKEKGYQEWNPEDDQCINNDTTQDSFDEVLKSNSRSPAEDYYYGRVLGLTKDPDGSMYDWSDYGQIQWELAACLFITWFCICLIVLGGVRSLGKASYVITWSPHVLLTLLLAYSVQLDGAKKGIEFYVKPEWEKLLDVQIWATAASQILNSLAIGVGSQLVLASYNRFEHNVLRDAVIISILNSLTSIYAGFVVFSVVGFIAQETNSAIDDVVESGIALAFVTYPTAVLYMPGAEQVWSFFFFLMLINLTMSTMGSAMQTIVAVWLDEFPSWQKHRIFLIIGLCLTFFCLGLSMLTNGGMHLYNVLDKKIVASLMLLTFFQVTVVSIVYGMPNFLSNLEEMGMKFPRWMQWVWKAWYWFVTPFIIGFLTVLSWIAHEELAYGDYVYPRSIQALGWVLELLPIIIFVAVSIFSIFQTRHRTGARGIELWKILIKPQDIWWHQGENSENITSSRKSSQSSSDFKSGSDEKFPDNDERHAQTAGRQGF